MHFVNRVQNDSQKVMPQKIPWAIKLFKLTNFNNINKSDQILKLKASDSKSGTRGSESYRGPPSQTGSY